MALRAYDRDIKPAGSKLSEPAYERGLQEWRVRGRDKRSLRAPLHRGEPRGDPLQRTAPSRRVAHDLDASRERRQILLRGGHHEDRPRSLTHAAHRALEQRLAAEREPRLGPAHSLALPAAQDDAAEP